MVSRIMTGGMDAVQPATKPEPPTTPVKMMMTNNDTNESTDRQKNESAEATCSREKVDTAVVKTEMTSQSVSPHKANQELSDGEDDQPLSIRKQKLNNEKNPKPEPKDRRPELANAKCKQEPDEQSEDDDAPLIVRKEKLQHAKKKRKIEPTSDGDDDDYTPEKKKSKGHRESKPSTSDRKGPKSIEPHRKKAKKHANTTPTKGKAVKKEEPVVWKWWEEDRPDDGTRWRTLEHNGPMFAPPYEPLPSKVHFYYDGHKMKLSLPTEEIATFYGRMIDHDYTTNEKFNKNFLHDWRKAMTPEEREKITDLKKCNFKEIDAHFKRLSEERKAMSKEEKDKLKAVRAAEQAKYGTAIVDGYEQKIGNFRIEPPGLFRGRGEHPKMGKLKKRVRPEDVIINCTKGKAPPPPEGHRWREVRHDNTVTWLASWTENVLGLNKYVMLNPSSRLKGEKDWQKFETARRLHRCVDKIREHYRQEWESKEMRIRQRAVALYFIDKLALRAGNEKETDEAADTVGCCSLRVEHIKLHKKLDDKDFVVEFDFLGKDSIRYFNQVPVEKRVFKNLGLFMENKDPGDDLFDRLTTSTLNKHLQDQMEGLTAKVFRTYNASITLQRQLKKLTDPDASAADKFLSYNRANRAVAILCNHQRAVPKTHEKSMENLGKKIHDKKKEVKELKKELERARGKNEKEKATKKLQVKREQLKKLKVQQTDKEENKEIALGTSKLNYLDPRITVAWCKKHNIELTKVYSKTQREKFQWAIDMADEDFEF